MKFTAIDFETANSKRESACSIGIAVVEDFKIIEKFSKLIKPIPNYYEPRNIRIHKITRNMTENEPDFSEQWQDLKPYFEDQILVAHNTSFDFSVLRQVLSIFDIEYPNLQYYCSYLGYKKHHTQFQLRPGLINYKLPTVCKYLGIDLIHHDAKSDAIASAKIMMQIMNDHEVTSFEDLAEKMSLSAGKLFPGSYIPHHVDEKKKAQHSLKDLIPQTTEFDTGHPFYGKNFVFTGKIAEDLSRDDAAQIVVDLGGKVSSGKPSHKTNFLVIGTYDEARYGKDFKSDSYIKAEKLIDEGHDLEILTYLEFIEMIHVGETSFEITVEDIEKHSEKHLERNMYNDFSGKKIYFTKDLSIRDLEAFQHVGNCSGLGHDYDDGEIPFTDYFVIADKHIDDLRMGIKSDSILKFEEVRNSSQNRGDLKDVQLISEKTFLEYIKRRERFQRKEIHMNIYEREVEEEYRITT